MTDRDKSRAVISSVGRTTTREYFKKHQNTMTFEPVGTTKDGKAFCVTSGYSKGSGEKIGNYAAHTLSKGCKSMVAEPIGTTADGKAFCFLANYHKVSGNNPNRTFEKHKDSMAAELISNKSEGGLAQICEYDDSGNPYKAISCTDGKKYLVYKVANNQITIKDKVYPISIKDGYYIIRKLTVLECMRLQTVPEWYDFSVVSDTQAYKMLGNGWCVEVIKHLLSYYK
jgi:DNA (cytosine-5)-methyltransferase 3A